MFSLNTRARLDSRFLTYIDGRPRQAVEATLSQKVVGPKFFNFSEDGKGALDTSGVDKVHTNFVYEFPKFVNSVIFQ